MDRRLIVLIAVGLVVALGAAASFVLAPKVSVLAGERIECVYGHVVKDDVKEIEVRKAEAANYGVKSETVTCAKHREAERLYAEAQAALAKGDTKTALAKLEAVAKLDPAFRKTREQTKAVRDGKKVDPDGGSDAPPVSLPDTSTPPTDDEDQVPVGPVETLLRWVPDTITGFNAQPMTADEFSVSRLYLAKSASAPASSLTIAVEQYKTASAASTAARKQIGAQYRTGGREVRFEGRTGYFGTYNDFAVLAWNEGTVLVAAEMQAAGGAKSPDLVDDLETVAAELLK